MERISTTPFGRRPVSAGLLAANALARTAGPVPAADKWSLFHDLRTARTAFGVSDRDLTVLNALLTFLPERELRDRERLIVFPSNAALAERAHGMAESTLRRHLAALVAAGLIGRHDSPNGKRYASRDAGGGIVRAFGLDLGPLLTRATEIVAKAQAARDLAARLKLAREAAVLRLRDARKLLDYVRAEGLPGDWQASEDRIAAAWRGLRRRLAPGEAERIGEDLAEILGQITAVLDPDPPAESEEMGGNDSQIGRHHSNTDKDILESEPCHERDNPSDDGQSREPAASPAPLRALSLGLVLKACPDILPYARSTLRHWHELVALAAHVRGLMGIAAETWDEAQRLMGRETAAIAVAAMLQRIGRIRNPGGYLRALSARAAAGGFSPGPMIMALLNADPAPAA